MRGADTRTTASQEEGLEPFVLKAFDQWKCSAWRHAPQLVMTHDMFRQKICPGIVHLAGSDLGAIPIAARLHRHLVRRADRRADVQEPPGDGEPVGQVADAAPSSIVRPFGAKTSWLTILTSGDSIP